MRRIHVYTFAESNIALFSPIALAAQPSGVVVPVAAGGKAQAVIVLGEAAGECTKFGATELQNLHALSEPDFAIVTDCGSRQLRGD